MHDLADSLDRVAFETGFSGVVQMDEGDDTQLVSDQSYVPLRGALPIA